MLSKELKKIFTGLTDIDSFLEVFKYFLFEEMVSYERINRRWREVLLIRWKSQKVLCFGAKGFCSKTDHQASKADYFPSDIFLKGYREIISRSRNLRALYINTTHGRHTENGITDEEKGQIIRNHIDLLTGLKEWCPLLEHLSVYPQYAQEIIPSLASVLAKDRLKCIWIPYVYEHDFLDQSYTAFPLLEGYALRQYSDLNFFPSIKRVAILHKNTTSRNSKMSRPLYSLASIARKERISCIYFTLDCPTVEAYLQPDLLDLCLFTRLLNFSFDVEGYLVSYLHLLKLPPSVMNLSLYWDTQTTDEDMGDFSLMLKSLLNLQSLSLRVYGSLFPQKDKVLPMVTECSPSLRKLSITFGVEGSQANIGLIASLTRLREVYLSWTNVTDTDIGLLLEKCPKIRRFTLLRCVGYSRDFVVQSFKTYSKNHPKRLLQIHLSDVLYYLEGGPTITGNLRFYIVVKPGS